MDIAEGVNLNNENTGRINGINERDACINYLQMAYNAGAPTLNYAYQLRNLYQTNNTFRYLNEFTCDLLPNATTSSLRETYSDVMRNICPATNRILNNEACLSSDDIGRILKEVQRARIGIANNIVCMGAIASVAIIAMQTYHIHNAWKMIIKARNIIDECGQDISIISYNIDVLNAGVIELEDLKQRWEDENVTAERKLRIINQIRMKISRMSTLLNHTLCKMCDLRVKINGKTEVLMVYQNQQLTNGLMNAVQLATNVTQYYILEGALSPGLKMLQGVVTAAYAVLTIGNVVTYCITDKELNILRQIYNDILSLENQVEIVMRAIHGAEDWLVLNDPI